VAQVHSWPMKRLVAEILHDDVSKAYLQVITKYYKMYVLGKLLWKKFPQTNALFIGKCRPAQLRKLEGPNWSTQICRGPQKSILL